MPTLVPVRPKARLQDARQIRIDPKIQTPNSMAVSIQSTQWAIGAGKNNPVGRWQATNAKWDRQ